MSIPVYLAVNHEENVNHPKKLLCQIGFGFHSNGSVRTPVQIMPNTIVIIDDLYLPNFSPSAIHLLRDKISNGCILDFERRPSQLHKKLIQTLFDKKILAVPSEFHTFAPTALPIINCLEPCNNWSEFLKTTQNRFPSGWMLELTPWYHTREASANSAAGYLQHALCRFRQEKDQLLYYDTKETLSKKITLAERFNCKGVIVLYSDLKNLWTN